MCCKRIQSLFFIEDLGGGEHVIPEIPAQIFRCAHIDFLTESSAQFDFHIRQINQPRFFSGVKLHQEIDVAIGPVLSMQDRAE